MESMLKTHPAVFAVGEEYQIMVSVTAPSLFWVRVTDGGGVPHEFFDESNGIMRSLSDLHRVAVPVSLLDGARAYTVCVRPLVERKPYFTETAPVCEYEYSFYPVPRGTVRAYHISDAHNHVDTPIRAARAFGDIDFLILNGDVIDHSGDPSKFDNIYEISSALMKGERPTVFSRGNHDMRGNFAERFAEYTPNSLGRTYYTFRLGGIYGILLDCGEDKCDTSVEYGYTVACHPFRLRETEYLRDIAARGEFKAPEVEHCVVVSHVPFTHRMNPLFNIEEDIYREWARILRDDIKPEVMICGHMHLAELWYPGCEHDQYGQACPAVIGAAVKYDTGYYVGCGYTFDSDGITVTFTDSNGELLSKSKL